MDIKAIEIMMSCTKPVSTICPNGNDRLCSKVFSLSFRVRTYFDLKIFTCDNYIEMTKGSLRPFLGFFSGWLSRYCDIYVFNWSSKPRFPIFPLCLHISFPVNSCICFI